jgi:Trypsin-like peptidase domain
MISDDVAALRIAMIAQPVFWAHAARWLEYGNQIVRMTWLTVCILLSRRIGNRIKCASSAPEGLAKTAEMNRPNLLRCFLASALCFISGWSVFAQTAAPAPQPPTPAEVGRAIPADNLAYPVLVELPGVDTGSGFYLNTATSIYLVTAKHVLFNEKGELLGPTMTLLSYARNPNDTGVNLVSADIKSLFSEGAVIPSASEDVAVVRVATFATPDPMEKQLVHAASRFSPGVVALEMAKTGFVTTPVNNVKKYADVFVGNEIVVYGYPDSIGLKQLPQLDPSRPLLRQGTVAGLNPATKSIVIDCPVYPGNSGGPVVEIDRIAFQTEFKLIGVVIQYVPFAKGTVNFYTLDNSGYAIVAPMDGVLALVK